MNQKKLVVVLLVLILALIGAAVWFATAPESGSHDPETERIVATGTVATAEPEKKAVTAAPARTRWIRVGPGTVVGVVREYGTEKPLEGVEMSLEAGLPGPNELLKAKTGPDGGFVFRGVTNFDSWTLRAKAPAPLADAEMAGVGVIEQRETDLGTVYLAPAFGVPGIVVDEKGVPVAGASVRAIKSRAASTSIDILRLIRELPTRAPAVDTATSGPDGKFEFRKVSPGRFDFTAEKSGFQTRVESGIVITPDAKNHPMKFVLLRGFQLDGKVIREGDGPIAGIPVVAFHQPQNPADFNALDKVFATTDEKGLFRLDGLGGGRYVVAVTPENEPAVADADVQVPSKEPLEIHLKGDCWLEGRVTGDEEKPVADAQVYAINMNNSPVVGNVKTDSDGRYMIRGLTSGPLQLFLVKAEGFSDYPDDLSALMGGRRNRGGGGGGGTEVKLEPGRNEKNVSLAKGATVRGVVKEKGEAGAPIGGARVELGTPAAFFGGNRGATTAADGTFEITSVPKGTSILMVNKDGWFQPGITPQSVLMVLSAQMMRGGQSQPAGKDSGKGATIVVSEPGEVLERTLELSRGSTLSGTVLTPDGQPVSGAQISVVLEGDGNQFTRMLSGFFPMPEPRLTDAQGHYETPGPPPGEKARVMARSAGYLDGKSEILTLTAGETKTGLDVKLREGATLAGKVRDDGGKPVDGALVKWISVGQDANDWSIRWRLRNATPTITDASGEFRIPNVETGKLAVQVTSPRHLSWSKNDVNAEDGRTSDFDVTLKTGGTLDGRVLDIAGRPKQGATVNWDLQGEVADDFDSNQETDGNATTDSNGNFHVEGLIPGEYELIARASGAAPSAPVRSAAGGQPVMLQLTPAFSISGSVVCKGGGATADLQIEVNTNVKVTAPNGTVSEQQRQVASARTGANGEFELKDVPGGVYDLHVSIGWGTQPRPNVVPTTVKDVQAGRQGLVIEVEAGLTITAIVTGEDGKPLESGWVWGRPDKPVAGVSGVNAQIEDGRFELTGLAPGKYRLTVSGPSNQQKVIVAEAGAKDLRVEFGGGGTIKVRVLKEDGTAAPNIWVNAQGEGGGGQAQTDANGLVELKSVGEGTFTVHANGAADGVPQSGRQDGVQVRAGAATDVEIRLAKRQ